MNKAKEKMVLIDASDRPNTLKVASLQKTFKASFAGKCIKKQL